MSRKRIRSRDRIAAADQYGYGSQYGYGTGASSQYGYGAYTYEPYGYGFGPYGLGSYGGGGSGGSYYGYGYYGAGVGVQVPTQASTNAQWTQAAVSALTPQGYTGQQVLGALAPYLAGQPLTQDQINVVQAAIAVEGYPPVDGPGGFPPAYKPSSTGGGGGGGQSGGNVNVPNVIGMSQVDAFRSLAAEGLKATGTKTIKGKILTVVSQNPPAGHSVAKGTTVKLTSKVEK
jgi:PASTA domain